MKNKANKTTAQDWLKMDIEAQSGAIWTPEAFTDLKEKIKMYTLKEHNIDETILKPDPMFYNGKVIKEIEINVLRSGKNSD